MLENYPRDELFQIDEDTLYRFAIEIMNLSERPRIRALARPDEFDRFVSVLVFVPKDRYDTAVRRRIGEYLARAYKGRMSAAYPAIPRGRSPAPTTSSAATRARRRRSRRRSSRPALPRSCAPGPTRWRQRWPRRSAARRRGRSRRATPAPSRPPIAKPSRPSNRSPTSRSSSASRTSARGPSTSTAATAIRDTRVNLKVFSRGASLPLSERVPLLENLGFKVVNERTYRVDPPGGEDSGRIWLHDMALERAAGGALDIGAIEGPIEATILALFRGLAESDAFNKLVLEAELGWRDVAMVRAFGRYLRQIRLAFGQDYLAATLARHGAIASKIVELFYARFDPARRRPSAPRRKRAIRAEIEGMLQAVESLEDDRILRRFVNLVEAAVRTNFFQIDENGLPRQTIAFKFECGRVDGLPLPKPLYEIFVYSPRVEGMHLRCGQVARGGIRWSDRPRRFPHRGARAGEGAAGQECRHRADRRQGRLLPEAPAAGKRPRGLARGGHRELPHLHPLAAFELTDNLVDDKVVPPPDTVRHDGDDPYFVVAADKGTATFSDIANAIALEQGHWLGDAFASRRQPGLRPQDDGDHGAAAPGSPSSAISARWASTSSREPVTVVGVGDMSGDVFGNGMLLVEDA